jgi:hypothetical protein
MAFCFWFEGQALQKPQGLEKVKACGVERDVASVPGQGPVRGN